MTRKMLILKWIFLGNIFTMGYKCTLLSNLIPIRYESTIDTLLDLEQSGLPLLITRDTEAHHSFANDLRPIVQRIYNKSILWTFTTPKAAAKITKRYRQKCH